MIHFFCTSSTAWLWGVDWSLVDVFLAYFVCFSVCMHEVSYWVSFVGCCRDSFDGLLSKSEYPDRILHAIHELIRSREQFQHW